jgi:hypothetical protein
MADYGNRNTRLTASRYAWSATLTRGPLRLGSNPSHDCSGTYTAQPNATVGDLLNGITTWYAQTYNVPVKDVVLVRHSLREM